MERASGLIGTATMICWVVVLGPLGAVLLASAAYAMVNGNMVLCVIFSVAMLSPVFLNVAWGFVAGISGTRGKVREQQAGAPYFPLRSNARVVPD